MPDDNDTLRERFADVAHAVWAHWMTYMFSKGYLGMDGDWHLPADLYRRWARQAKTPYADLTGKEQESDRDQADKYLAALRDWEKP